MTAVATAALFPATAAAQAPPPEDVPAASAYVEAIPTGRGSRPSGAAGGNGRSLDPRVEATLEREGGSDAPVLRDVATSPAYGAPEKRARPQARLRETDEAGALSAVVPSVDGDAEGRLLALLAAIAAIAIAAAAVAARQRRASRARSG